MKGAVGTRGRVTSLSESLLPPIGVGGKGGFSETGESEEEKENALVPFSRCLSVFPLRHMPSPLGLPRTRPERERGGRKPVSLNRGNGKDGKEAQNLKIRFQFF